MPRQILGKVTRFLAVALSTQPPSASLISAALMLALPEYDGASRAASTSER